MLWSSDFVLWVVGRATWYVWVWNQHGPVFLSEVGCAWFWERRCWDPFVSFYFKEREPRFRGAGSASTPCSSSRQPWDPMAFHFITEELRHQMSHPLLMGLAASGVSLSSKLRSSLSEGFWPCCFPHLDKRSAAVAARGPAGQTEDGGGKREKAPREISCRVYYVVSFLWNEKKREGKENMPYTRVPQSPFVSSHTHYGWNHEIFAGLEWPKHLSENRFLQKGEPGQVLFIILISLTPLLSPKTWGEGGGGGHK